MYFQNIDNLYMPQSEINSEDVYSAWAAERLGVGNAAFKKLYSALGSAENVYKLSDYSQFKLTENQAKKLSDKNTDNAEKSIRSAIEKGFLPLSYGNVSYPEKLKQLSNPPSIIYCKGKIPEFDKYLCVGIVGTRTPSRDALEETFRLTSDLSKKGIIIISGLAMGIDSQAHSTAVIEDGFTVGVSGVKAGQIYPKRNRFLYEKIYENGLVICEHSPTDTVENGSFPKRNRIISALSDALVMVEAPIKSGALITAEKSLSLKKAVFVPFWNRPSNEGGKSLIEKKAFKLRSEKDVTDFLEGLENKEYFPLESPVFLLKSPKEKIKSENVPKISVNKTDIFSKSENNISSKEFFTEENVIEEFGEFEEKASDDFENVSYVPDELTEIEKNVYLYIKNNYSPSTDKIITGLGFSHSETISAISMLEIYGYVRKLPGDKWSIV